MQRMHLRTIFYSPTHVQPLRAVWAEGEFERHFHLHMLPSGPNQWPPRRSGLGPKGPVEALEAVMGACSSDHASRAVSYFPPTWKWLGLSSIWGFLPTSVPGRLRKLHSKFSNRCSYSGWPSLTAARLPSPPVASLTWHSWRETRAHGPAACGMPSSKARLSLTAWGGASTPPGVPPGKRSQQEVPDM